MSMLKKIAITLGVAVVAIGAAGYGTFWYMNRIPPQLKEPNYFTYYKTQDTTPVGKVGIFVSGLIMPESFRLADFHNLALKSSQYVPWPMRSRATADTGVVLLDTEKFYEFEPFEPTNLMDVHGNTNDVDGVPYVEKYRRGEVTWVPPKPTLHFDHGYFLYTGRMGGMPTPSQKLATKARIYYYGAGKGLVNGRIPHEAGERAIVEGGMARIHAKYGPIPYRFVTAEDFGAAREQLRSLLDEGIDTLVFAPLRPIYSHHEEFNGAIKHAMHDLHDWEREHGKKIKVIITPQLGDMPGLADAYLNMLRDRLRTFPENASVKVLISIHGMAWDRVPNEAWIQLSPPYVNRMLESARKVLAEEFELGKTEVVQTQDHFADPHSDPEGKYLSTNRASWEGVKEGYDYVVNLPIEFVAENTDTMFSHAMYNFEGFPGYDIYQPIDYSDWSVPYTRSFKIERTEVIYNGLPVGRYNVPIIEAYSQAIDQVLSKGMKPVEQAAKL